MQAKKDLFFNYYLLVRSIDERAKAKKEGSPIMEQLTRSRKMLA
jgi:glycerol-3-phosphate cytidylyltransferase-like family protein